MYFNSASVVIDLILFAVALHKLKYVMRSGGRPDPLGNPFNGSQGSLVSLPAFSFFFI